MLPELGQVGLEDHGAVITELSRLARESEQAGAEWVGLVDLNLQIFDWGCSAEDKANGTFVVNEIQNAVIAATDIQTKQPPRAKLKPVETGDPGVTFWTGPDPAVIGLQLPVAPGQPIDPALLMALRAIPGLSEDWLTTVNDKVVAEVEQLAFNYFWDRSDTDMFLESNLLTTNKQGFHFALYEFDDDEQRHVLRNLSVRQVFIDPTCEDIKDAAYAGINWYLDKNEAKKHYPHLADAIEEARQTGTLRVPDNNGDLPGSFDHQFYRDMVILRVFWLRNQIIPLSLEEALALQLVIEAPLPEDVVQAQPAAGSDVPVPLDDDTAPPVAPVEVGLFLAARDDLGNVVPGEPISAPFVGDDGRQVLHPSWPKRRGIREIVSIADKVEADRACEHWDIPLLHNVNIPITGKPYGHGEPFRLAPLQAANSRMLDSVVQHAERFKTPLMPVMRSVYDTMKKEYGTIHFEKKRVIVPDAKWSQFIEGAKSIVSPPPLPEALVEAYGLTKNAITENSGHTEVLQGRASGDMSGRAIETLQNAAASLIGFKSRRTEHVVTRLSRLMLHNLVHRLSVDHLARICSKYPRPVLEHIHMRAKQIEWNVTVIVESGSGEILARRKAEIRQDYKDGLISWESAIEELGYDVAQEKRRMVNQQQMALGSTQAGAGPLIQPAAA